MNVNEIFSTGVEIATDTFPFDQVQHDIVNSINQTNDSLIVIIVFIGAILGALIIRSLRR